MMPTLLALEGNSIMLCVLIVAVNMADISVCGQNFKYHQPTHTCMSITEQSTSYVNSETNCKNLKGGPDKVTTGHLVYIYNEDTDIFVKGLLRTNTATAHIGLKYQKKNNKEIYRWGNSREPIEYAGWEVGTTHPNDETVVVISKTGWRQVRSNTLTYYICQVDAELKLPTMTCPPMLVGQEKPEIQCILNNKDVSISGSEFSTVQILAACNTAACNTGQGYEASLRNTRNTSVMSLTILSVSRNDEGLLTCSWNISSYPGTLSTTCNLTVYELPRDPPQLTKYPNHVAYQKGNVISISCTVNGGFPAVNLTIIYCDPEIKDTSTNWRSVTANGNKAEMSVTIDEDMNNKSCDCYARHVSNKYNLRNSLIFSVIAPAKVKTLTFTYAVAKENFSEIDVDQEVRITCSASGNPAPLLSLYYTDFEHLLQMKTGYQLIHSLEKTSCNDSGSYICEASNSHKYPHKLVSNLKVKCPPTLCNTEERNLVYGVVLNTHTDIRMCVFAYPKPSTLFVYKVVDRLQYHDGYTVTFNYTDEVQCRALISLTARHTQQRDLGNFSLYLNSKVLPFIFTVVEKGPPSCPQAIQVKNVAGDMITLAWIPGRDGGLAQTFIILRHDAMIEVGRVKDTKIGIMEYNVTGLSAMTTYVISVDVESEKGRSNCSNVVVNVTTNATSSSARSESNISPTAYVIPIVILLVLVVIGILIVIVVRRRRRSHQDFKKMLPLEQVKTRPPKLEDSKDKEEDKSLDTSIYNSATLDTSEPKNKIKAIVRKPKGNSSKSKHASAKDVDIKEDGGMEGETYAQVLKVNKQKVNKAEAAENIYNNQLEMVNFKGHKSSPGTTIQSASDWPKNGTNEAGDDNVVYANTIQSLSPALSETKTSPEPNTNEVKGNEKSARTLSPEGLVYVSVEISAATKKPVIKEQKEMTQPQADQVEYTSIDHLATSESNPVVDDGQE